jgi:GNAT superfamily N-acetyltransferase
MRTLVRVDSHTDVGALRHLLDQQRYGRYCEDSALPSKRVTDYLLHTVQDHFAGPNNQALAIVTDTGEMVGLLLHRLSSWDTEHFGFPFAIVDGLYTAALGYAEELDLVHQLLQGFERWCQNQRIRFASIRIPSRHLPAVHGLEQSGFRLIEAWIYNKFDLARLGDTDKVLPSLRNARPEDGEYMLEYSKGAFSTHRFHADPRILPEKADSLYCKWILTALSDPQQEILTADQDGEPYAFMVFYRNDFREYFGVRMVQWKMALLDPHNRGKGLGTDFFLALLHRHRAEGMDVVDSGLSMRNLTSLNLHNKLGFRVVSTIITFHKWFD